MSLAKITDAIEKVAFIQPGLGKVMMNAAKSPAAWKSVGKKSLIGAGVGSAANVVAGDKDQSVLERATKGAVGGGAVGGLYGAGRLAYKANKGLGLKGFKNNPEVHGVAGKRTPEQATRFSSDQKAHMKMNLNKNQPA